MLKIGVDGKENCVGGEAGGDSDERRALLEEKSNGWFSSGGVGKRVLKFVIEGVPWDIKESILSGWVKM